MTYYHDIRFLMQENVIHRFSNLNFYLQTFLEEEMWQIGTLQKPLHFLKDKNLHNLARAFNFFLALI